MSDETQTIEAPAPAAPAPAPAAEAPAAEAAQTEAPATEGEAKPEEGEKKPEEKKERHPLELENRRLRRRLENQAAKIGSFEEQLRARGLQPQPIDGTNGQPTNDSETLTLTRAELDRLSLERARQLAPELAAHQSITERRQGVFDRIETELGSDTFAELSRDLEDSLGGSLKDAKGHPKPIVDAIFDSDAPAMVLKYLADVDNAAEVASLSRMPPVQLGMAMAKLESKLAAKKAEEKPQPSKAAPVVEPIKGGGVPNNLPSDSDPIDVWLKKERAREAKLRQGHS